MFILFLILNFLFFIAPQLFCYWSAIIMYDYVLIHSNFCNWSAIIMCNYVWIRSYFVLDPQSFVYNYVWISVLDPGLQGTGSAFRGRLRVVAFDPQWFFASTLMFEKISNFFWKWPKNIFGKNLKILKIPKKWDFWKIFDYFKKTSSIWACWGSVPLTGTTKSIKGMPRTTFPWILKKLIVR